MIRRSPLLTLLLLGACAGSEAPTESTESTGSELVLALPEVKRPKAADFVPREGRELPAALSCPTSKLQFSQASGCVNDGSVEFCVPKNDTVLRQRLESAHPTISAGCCSGRAQCNLTTEQLYFFPTRANVECTAWHGGLTAPAWSELCAIAAEPAIRGIVPTWYE
jgi:hypothetical protein